MARTCDEGGRRLVHFVSPQAWGIIIAILGTLVFVPVGLELFGQDHGNRWAEALMLLVGLWGSVALWRYLARPVRPEDETYLFPEPRMRRQRRDR